MPEVKEAKKIVEVPEGYEAVQVRDEAAQRRDRELEHKRLQFRDVRYTDALGNECGAKVYEVEAVRFVDGERVIYISVMYLQTLHRGWAISRAVPKGKGPHTWGEIER